MKHLYAPMKVLFVLLALTALLLTACGSGGSGGDGSTEEPASTPGAGGGGAPQMISKDLSLDPANAADADSLFVIGYLYEGLFNVEGGEIAPVLAESYTPANDGLDYIVVLRSNVAFHDGSPLNADAVIANFNRWFDKDNAAHGAGEYAAWASVFGGFKGETGDGGKPKSNFDGIEKVDEHTVLIHLNTADALFLAKLVNPAFFIVSPAAFGAGDFGAMQGKASGTGRYQLSSWSDSGLTLQPFSGYWGAPASGALEFQFK